MPDDLIFLFAALRSNAKNVRVVTNDHMRDHFHALNQSHGSGKLFLKWLRGHKVEHGFKIVAKAGSAGRNQGPGQSKQRQGRSGASDSWYAGGGGGGGAGSGGGGGGSGNGGYTGGGSRGGGSRGGKDFGRWFSTTPALGRRPIRANLKHIEVQYHETRLPTSYNDACQERDGGFHLLGEHGQWICARNPKHKALAASDGRAATGAVWSGEQPPIG